MFKMTQLKHHDTFLVFQWNKLVEAIQRRIEAFVALNDSGETILRGNIVRMMADRTVHLTTDDSAANQLYVGVSTERIADGETGVIRTDNRAYVLFEANLDPAPAAGDWAFCGSADGLATNDGTEPDFLIPLGRIVDASLYATEGACYVLLNKCCTPLGG